MKDGIIFAREHILMEQILSIIRQKYKYELFIWHYYIIVPYRPLSLLNDELPTSAIKL